MRLAFIGGGTMAEAIIKGVLSASLAQAEEVSVGEILKERCQYLQQQYGIYATVNNVKAAQHSDLVILAVKPQNLGGIASELKGNLSPQQTALSIIAGARMSTLAESLGHPSVIRVMPNTPAQIGAGMSLWISSSGVEPEKEEMARSILQTLGQEIQVHAEEYLDMATALSASGPAYVFLFIEALLDAGVYLGLPREMARNLVLQTLLGSVRLVSESGKHPAELKDMVTSPGGTTAEALLALEEGGFRAAVINAVIAAYEKSLELGEA